MKILSQFESSGNIELLSQKIIAVFSSKDTPQEIYPYAVRIFEELKNKPLSIASGWQAPLEKKLLETITPQMQANIIFYTANDLSQVNISHQLKLLNNENKLLSISAQSRKKRATKNDIDKRDKLLFNQVDQVLFLYISQNGRLEKYFNHLLESASSVLIMRHPLNKPFMSAGCSVLDEENFDEVL